MKTFEDIIREMPADLRQDVEDFIETLVRKRRVRATRRLKLGWKGALSKFRDRCNSVELQHEIARHWGG